MPSMLVRVGTVLEMIKIRYPLTDADFERLLQT